LTTAVTANLDAAPQVHRFIPAATDLAPSRTIACASTVAVVVPSPAVSLVLEGDFAQHLRAHILELVLQLDFLGDGHAVLGDARRAEALFDNDIATLGPSVTFTALARTSTPRSMRSRASPEN